MIEVVGRLGKLQSLPVLADRKTLLFNSHKGRALGSAEDAARPNVNSSGEEALAMEAPSGRGRETG